MNFQSKSSIIKHSITDLKMNEFIFIWEIRNFRSHDFQNRPELLSPDFSTGTDTKHTWYIHIIGENEYLSFVLFLRTNDGPEVNVTLIFSICGQESNKNISKEVSFIVKYGMTEKRHLANFVKIDHLLDEKNGLLVNGTLTIKCKLYYEGHVINCLQIDESNLHINSALSHDMESLFTNKKLSDVKIVIGQEEFQAHKCILATRSRVFSAMFEHVMLEKSESIVRIEDIDPKVMEEVLRFMYCGKIKNEKLMTADLLAAADKYELEELKKMCEDKLLDTLNGENIGEILVFADRYKAEKLKKHVLNFIISRAKDINYEKFKTDVELYSPLLIDLVREFIYCF